MFARYAYPPNALGYCGPGSASVLLQQGPAAAADIGAHARQFEGAWIYLELIAAAAGIADPLDARVVDAYWLGNDLLGLVDDADLPARLQARLPSQPGAAWLPGRAHHGYHVFAVYPWLGLLARGRGVPTALKVLDQCRIRWGTITAADTDQIRLTGRRLELVDGSLRLGDPVEQSVPRTPEQQALLPVSLEPGDTVALHWDWVCDRLDEEAADRLAAHTADQLRRAAAVFETVGGAR